MLRRITFGLLASGGVLFVAGAAGLVGTWAVIGGTLVLLASSLLMAVDLESRDVGPWPPAPRPQVDVPQLERAA